MLCPNCSQEMMELNQQPALSGQAAATAPCHCHHSHAHLPKRGHWRRVGNQIVIELGPPPAQPVNAAVHAEYESFEFSPELEAQLMGESSLGESGW